MFLFFDTETTGLPKNWDAPATDINNWPRLVQLAYLIYDDNGNLLSSHCDIIKPFEFSIPQEASNIHRIDNETANRVGKPLLNVLLEFKQFLNNADYVIGHNISFDEKIIDAEFLRCGLKEFVAKKTKICTMLSSIDYCAIETKRGFKYPKLSELYFKLFGTHFNEAHQADIDIKATAKCFWKLVEIGIIKLPKKIVSNLQDVKQPDVVDVESITKINKRLQLIQSLIDLGDKEEINIQANKIKLLDAKGITNEITDALFSNKFTVASALIIDYLKANQTLAVYVDPEITALELEIKHLEQELVETTNEKAEIEKAIAQFNNKLHNCLGALIENLYQIKDAFYSKLKTDLDIGGDELKKEEAKKLYEENKQHYESYKQQQKAEKKKVFFELNEEEQLDIKKLFKECVKLYRPDKFPNDEIKQDQAQEIFIQVQLTYERSDYNTIKQLHQKLIAGILTHEIKQQNNKDLFVIRINDLHSMVQKNKDKIEVLKNTEVYNLIQSIADINGYFDEQIALLEIEIESWDKKLTHIPASGLIKHTDATLMHLRNVLPQKTDIKLIPYRKGDKWGFCDENKNIIVQCIYDYVNDFNHGLAEARLNGKWGFINNKGEQVIPCIYDRTSDFNEGLAPVKVNKKWGFINTKGEQVIPCIYDYTSDFNEWLAPVEVNKKWGVINTKGEQVIPCIYERAYGFNEGLASVQLNGKYGFINTKGEQVIPCIFDENRSFNEGIASVRVNRKWGVINKKGEQVIPCIYDDAISFNEWLAYVRVNGKWGFINTKGEQVIPCIYDRTSDFNEGLAPVEVNKKWGFINTKGEQVIPCIYDFGYFGGEGFREGLVPARVNEKWGFINKKGEQVIPCIYDDTISFNEGLTSVRVNGKSGFINTKGEQVTPFIYSHTAQFNGGLALVEVNGKWGYINNKGIEYWEE